jgi:hypothetical protein
VQQQALDFACVGVASSYLLPFVRTVHEQRRDHACPQCDAAFGEAGTLRRHVRTVHELGLNKF